MESNGLVINGYSSAVKSNALNHHGNEESSVCQDGSEDSKSLQPNCHQISDGSPETPSGGGFEVGVIHRLRHTDVPLLFREAHVLGGFRPLHRPGWYYLLSAFHLHNESMNVWSHLLATVLMTYKLVRFSYSIDFLYDPYTWPLLAGLFCGMCLYLFSAAAHCMQSKSELYHYTMFMIDYAGIGLYGLGSVIVHIHYCSEDAFYNAVTPWFIPAGCLLAIAICVCCAVAKVIYTRPYPFTRKLWQILPVLGIYVLLISPIVHRLITHYVTAEEYTESISYHFLQIFYFFLSGVCFAADVPQRFFPGKCDYFCHSHQLFHVAIMLCTLYQMEAVFLDFGARRPLVEARPTPTLTSAFAPVVITILAEAASITLFWFYIRRNLLTQQEAAVKKDKSQ